MAYASIYQMEYNVTSRKDDLVSLVYLLLSLLENQSFTGFQNLNRGSEKDRFRLTYRAKIRVSQVEMCKGQASGLRDFAAHINQMGFYDTPDYPKLKELLIEGLDMFDLRTDEEFKS